MKILYFARIRESIGCSEEELLLPPDVSNVAQLLELLRARGDNWAQALSTAKSFRVAVDQQMARADTSLSSACEVAIFPPVTGG